MTAELLAFVFQSDNGSYRDDSAGGRHKRSDDSGLEVRKSDGPSDQHLVAQIQLGNREAFDTLVKRYHLRLIATAEASLGGQAEAEDLVQDILLKIWVNRKSWTPTHGAAVYFFGSLSNRIRNVWRDRKRLDRSLETVRTEFAPQTESLAEEIAAVWDEVAELPERWRTALTLRYLNDLTFAQVGAQMNISENAAKKLVQRAIGAMNEALSIKK